MVGFQSAFRTTLGAALTTTATTITLSTVPTVTSGRLTIFEGNIVEFVSYTGVSGSTVTGVTRNLSLTADPVTGGTGLAWGAGTKVIMGIMHDQQIDKENALPIVGLTTVQKNALNMAQDYFTGTYPIVYDTTLGSYEYWNGSAWTAFATGTVANASDTVAGKVETATTAESKAGTDTGGTGAQLVAHPSDIAKNTQSGTFVYGTDVGGDDTYVVALTPVLAAYTAGQTLYFKPTTANTGACTVDFGPGVLNIKTKDGNDPQSGVLRALVEVTGHYDGTNFVIDAEDFATTANKGIAEMATDVEAAAGVDQTRYVNAYQLGLAAGIVPEQVIPVKVSANTGYASNLQMGSSTDGSVLFVATYHVATVLEIFRLVRETSGQYIITHATTLATTNMGGKAACMVAGNYLYVTVNDNGTGILRRYDKADLANVATMTISGTAIGTGGSAGFSDDTNLYISKGADTFGKYTISGTTATYDSDITYTSAGTVANGGATCNGTNVWTIVSANGSNTIRKYALAGGAAVSSTVRFFYTSAYPNPGQLGLYVATASKLGIAMGFTIESNSAVVSSAIKTNAIALP